MELPSQALCQERLARIFPETLPQRGRLTNQLAASAIFVALYVDAVEGRNKLRPSMVLWMCDQAAARVEVVERREWYEASLKGKRHVASLLDRQGIRHDPWYADNTREPLRDETFRAWADLGAIVRDETVATTSSKPQWSLARDFATLFNPEVGEADVAEQIDDWQDDHHGAIGRTRIALSRQLASPSEQVLVEMPGGSRRTLAPGGSSLILKGVIEQLVPRLFAQPAVLFISESRKRIDVVDERLLDQLGIELDAGRLLPDALLFDADPGLFWFVEAVLTDGPIDESRKKALERWAAEQGIPVDRCRYLTAFMGRTAGPFRTLGASLAWGTSVWFLDEPDKIVHLESLNDE